MPELPKGVFEHEGRWWTAKPDATASFDEFIVARATLREIHGDSLWNPWVREDRADESDRALAVMEEWTRAEPGFRQMTEQEIDEMFAESDRRIDAEHAADIERWERDKERYDSEREAARLALIEHRSRFEHVSGELERFSAMDQSRQSGWTRHIAELEKEEKTHPPEIERLEALVGDPENVVDVHGYLPRDRRSTMLVYYRLDRERDVRELRKVIPELTSALKATTDKAERSKLRSDLQGARYKLERLLAVPPLDAENMCSECPKPAAKHGWVSPPYDAPCPAWPRWGARLEKVRQMLLEIAERSQPPKPEPVKPQPLAVVPSGLPIAETIARLTVLQAEHPNAVVKRGRANRWELWAADDSRL